MGPYVPDLNNLTRDQDCCNQTKFFRNFTVDELEIFWRYFQSRLKLLLRSLEFKAQLLSHILSLVFTKQRDVGIDIINLVCK